MKRCPKCNRTFPDDNQKFCTIDGGLLQADQRFDPNATIASSAYPAAEASEPDYGATIATSSTAPTVVLPKDTGPTGQRTAANFNQPQPERSAAAPPAGPPPSSAPPGPEFGETVALPRTPVAPPPKASSAPLPQAAAAAAAVPVNKKSKVPLVLGILAILLVLGIGGLVAAFFLVIKPRLDQVNSERTVVTSETPVENVNNNANPNATASSEPTPETTEFEAPPGNTKFTNSEANLEGTLAENYFDFSFYYPDNWEADPKAGTAASGNFVKVERRLPPDFTQENFAVRPYPSKGTYAADLPDYPSRVEEFDSSLAKILTEYRKVSEGPTKINSLDAYEFRWEADSKGTKKGDLKLWGRVVFVPTGVEGDKAGAILSMFTTSLAPELSGVEDVGVKGQTAIILESFRFAKNR